MNTLEIATDGRGITTVTLARPEQHNAMDATMIAELTAAFTDLGTAPETRAIVLTGKGKSFCAGGDLGWMRDQIAADAPTRAAAARALATMLGTVDACPKPVIARCQGNAFGGGVGLLCVADVALGAEGLRLGLTETRLGLIPATIGPYVIARIGAGTARRVFMSARLFDTQEAVSLGILARAVSPEALDAAVEREVAPYLSTAPGAVAEAKALARDLGSAPGPEAIERSVQALLARWESAEARDGIAAFFDRRPPPWARPEQP